MRENEISETVIGAAIEVHRHLGPGLLESAYQTCMQFELRQARLGIDVEKPLPVRYKGIELDCGYRLDVVVENAVILELKAIEALLPIHEAQLLTYLRLTGLKLGLLINFNVPLLRSGIRRIVNNL
jgi:GxxExxY protein